MALHIYMTPTSQQKFHVQTEKYYSGEPRFVEIIKAPIVCQTASPHSDSRLFMKRRA